MAMMALGMGLVMTAIAVAIGGLVVEAVLLLIHHRLQVAAAVNQRAGHAALMRAEREDDLTGALDWIENVAV